MKKIAIAVFCLVLAIGITYSLTLSEFLYKASGKGSTTQPSYNIQRYGTTATPLSINQFNVLNSNILNLGSAINNLGNPDPESEFGVLDFEELQRAVVSGIEAGIQRLNKIAQLISESRCIDQITKQALLAEINNAKIQLETFKQRAMNATTTEELIALLQEVQNYMKQLKEQFNTTEILDQLKVDKIREMIQRVYSSIERVNVGLERLKQMCPAQTAQINSVEQKVEMWIARLQEIEQMANNCASFEEIKARIDSLKAEVKSEISSLRTALQQCRANYQGGTPSGPGGFLGTPPKVPVPPTIPNIPTGGWSQTPPFLPSIQKSYIMSFDVRPKTIDCGGYVTLEWTTEGFNECVITASCGSDYRANNWCGALNSYFRNNRSTSGKVTIGRIFGPTEFKLTCVDSKGTLLRADDYVQASDPVLVQVKNPDTCVGP